MTETDHEPPSIDERKRALRKLIRAAARAGDQEQVNALIDQLRQIGEDR
jgi:hypothetical protein